MDCRSCGHANASDRVECSHCEALLVDVFETIEERTDPIMAVGRDLSAEADDSGNGFTRFPTDIQYSGDLPRLFRFGNRYQVLEKLGEGGMGRVYKALDLELDRPVALKTIRAEKGRGPEVLKRFKQELILARKITHKNVVRIYDLGEAEGGLKFFTMELVEGQSLRDLLNEKKTIPAKEAISFMKQMLSGLAEAHSQGVFHRDLKPQNIMVDGSGVLRIMDFGIARTADTATLTGTGEMMGTPDYISPEQVKGETTTAQSDLYATGIILYELLTGEVPFKGDTAISKVVARLQVKPVPPRTLNPQIPAYLERIIIKLMEVDPDLRYKTADEVLQDLEREQVDSSLWLRTRKAIYRRRGWIAAVVVGSLGLGAWLFLRDQTGEVQADVPVTTIAILPFNNMTSAAELEWMETGIPEMLVTDISQSKTLRPLLGDRVRRMLDDLGKTGQISFDEKTLTVFSNMAGVDYILHGGFLESEGLLRVDMILRETATGVGTPMKLDAKPNEVFALVDSITERISAALDLDTLFDRNRPIAEVATSSIDAFREYQEGIDNLRDGRNQAAITALRESIALDDQFAMAHAKLAEAQWNLGESSSAKDSIKIAQDVGTEQPLPLPERFQIHAIAARINDDPDTAIEAYRRLAEFFPSDPDVMLSLASALESKGEMNQALDAYQSVVNARPTYGAALLGMSRVLITLDRPQEAISLLEKVAADGTLEHDLESLGMLHSILGVAFRTANDRVQALEHFELSLSARRRAGDRRGVIASLVHIGLVRKELQQLEAALASLNEAVEAARALRIPTLESFALQNLGNLALEAGRLDEALDHYRDSLSIELDIKENNEIAYRLDAIAEVYRLRGQYVDSLVYLEQAKTKLEGIDEPSERGFNLSILGQINRARGEYDDATEALLSAIPLLDPTNLFRDLVSARRALACIYIDQGRFQEALEIIEQTLARFKEESGVKLATARVHYAEFLTEMGAFSDAAVELDGIQQLVPDVDFEARPYYHYLRGRVLMALGDGSAEKHLRAALAEASKGRDALLAGRASVSLGRHLLEKAQIRSARTVLNSALQEAKRYEHRAVQAEAALALAELEASVANFEAAQSLLTEAKDLASSYQGMPLLARINEAIGFVAKQRGESKAAEKANEEASIVRQWLTDRVPPQYVKSFQASWLFESPESSGFQ